MGASQIFLHEIHLVAPVLESVGVVHRVGLLFRALGESRGGSHFMDVRGRF
jgi:hypothetical protein